MTKIRRTLMSVAATAATLLALTLGAAPAHAAGYSYDGTLPNTAAGGYCASGSSPIKTYPIKVGGSGATVGTLTVQYSPSCGTNWVILDTSTTGYTSEKTIDRATNWYHHMEPDFNAPSSFSPQVYAPGSTCISVLGELTGGGGTYATSGWQYIC